MKFKLHNTDSECDVYKWESSDEMVIVTLFHWKKKNTIEFEREEFVLKDEMMYVPMQNETDEWLKHSCEYGHWQVSNMFLELDEETLEFALSLLKKGSGGK